jgi:hypothetical protein
MIFQRLSLKSILQNPKNPTNPNSENPKRNLLVHRVIYFKQLIIKDLKSMCSMYLCVFKTYVSYVPMCLNQIRNQFLHFFQLILHANDQFLNIMRIRFGTQRINFTPNFLRNKVQSTPFRIACFFRHLV